jgi:CRP-like cAMP-binding protein
MDINFINVLEKSFIFNGLTAEEIKEICKTLSLEIKDYKRGESIYLPNSFESKIGFIARGECLIEKYKPSGESVPLNILKQHSSFGIMAVLSVTEEFPTHVVASKDCSIVFLPKESFEKLIESNSKISGNVIRFLASKISFLNKKISTFSSDNVTEKLASHIYLRSIEENSDCLNFNCKKTAEIINVGRASLYRAISVLTNEGLIILENKKIYIKDLKGLERITK